MGFWSIVGDLLAKGVKTGQKKINEILKNMILIINDMEKNSPICQMKISEERWRG